MEARTQVGFFSSAFSTLTSFITQPAVTSAATSFVHGFFHPLKPFINMSEQEKMSDTYTTVWEGVGRNAAYFAADAVYEVVSTTVLSYLPYAEYSAPAVNFVVRSGMRLGLVVDNAMTLKKLAYQAWSENPNNNPFSGCGCGVEPQLKSMVASTAYAVVNYGIVECLIPLIPAVKNVAFPIRGFLSALLNGQMIVENLTADAWMCTQHRYNAAPFWFPLSMGLTLELIRYYGSEAVKSFGIANAMDSFLFNALTFFYVAAIYAAKMPGNGKHHTLDFSYFPTKMAVDKAVNYFWNAESKEESYVVSGFKYIFNSGPLVWARTHTYGGSFLSREQFGRRPSVASYIALREKWARGWIVWLAGIRMMPYIEKIIAATDRADGYVPLPEKLKDNKPLLKWLLKDETQFYLHEAQEFLIHFRLDSLAKKAVLREKTSMKVLTDDDRSALASEVEAEIKRLHKCIPPLDKGAIQECEKKIKLFESLLTMLNEVESEQLFYQRLLDWSKTNKTMIESQRNFWGSIAAFSGLFNSDSALLIQDLKALFEKDASSSKMSKKKQKQAKEKIKDRINALRAEKLYLESDNFVHTEKMRALTMLDSIVQDERYQKIPFEELYFIWKEYYWHVVSAQRSVKTMLQNIVGEYLGGDWYKQEVPKTQVFVERLYQKLAAPVRQRLVLQPPPVLAQPSTPSTLAIRQQRSAPVLFASQPLSSPEPPQYKLIRSALETKKMELSKRGLFNKVAALDNLISRLPRLGSKSFGEIISEWKQDKGEAYWKTILQEEPSAKGVVTGLGRWAYNAVVATESRSQPKTATFIDQLEEQHRTVGAAVTKSLASEY